MKTLRRAPSDARVVPMTATAARTAGDPVVYADGVGIQQNTVANGEIGAVMIGGQHKVVKFASEAWAEGEPVYLDVGADNFTTTLTANTLAGFAIKAAASADVVGEIYLTEPPGTGL